MSEEPKYLLTRSEINDIVDDFFGCDLDERCWQNHDNTDVVDEWFKEHEYHEDTLHIIPLSV